MFVSSGAEFYEPEGPRDWRARFRLWRKWGVGPMAVVCGANPSVADADRLDPTMHRIITLLRDSHGGYVMVNALPIVDPSPAGADLWCRVMKRSHPEEYALVMRMNLEAIQAEAMAADTVIVAWGNLVAPGNPLIGALSGGGRPIMCWGHNLNRSPRHPLSRGRNRIVPGTPLVEWRP